jgi:hypothetical protein
MQRMFVAAVAILTGCGAAHAQSSPSMSPTNSVVGTTSPLGIPGSNGSGGTGIPLGATEIDPGGLSPSVAGNCGAGGSYAGMFGTASQGLSGAADSAMSGMSASGVTGAASTFDGGGLAGVGSAISTCSPSAGVSSTGAASPLSTSAANSMFRLDGGAVPLGATEIGSAGVSPMISPQTTPCAGVLSTTTSTSATGAMGVGVGSSSGC